ncbi:hypothetical protein [Pseudohalioglobus lutimaris]|nr:hypothetical protein [Pseudohalioglobus lutimaris]
MNRSNLINGRAIISQSVPQRIALRSVDERRGHLRLAEAAIDAPAIDH